ncbi:MAG: HD domain-containing protein, partial [Thermoplasmata archaeon]|nr:HD domain-containing protein [Thermoplasmata archaeon]
MTLSEATLKISEYAVHMDWDMAFDGKSKGNRHLFRVNRFALYLNEIERGVKDIVVAGAWLHDVGLVEGNEGHCFKGAKIAREFLAGLYIDTEAIERILHCIEAHDGEVEARSIEAKIVHDADTVDKMGPLGLMRHTWKMANVDYHNYTVEELLEFLPKHLDERRANLYLDSARKIADRYAPAVKDFFADEDHAIKIIGKVMELAKEGVPTEAILDRLRTEGRLKEGFVRILEEQLSLS